MPPVPRRGVSEPHAPKPVHAHAPPRAPSGRGPTLVLVALLAAAVVAAHAPVLDSQGMALDDPLFVTNNTLVRHPGWGSVGRFFGEVLAPSTVSAYYMPLSMTSLMLDCAMGGRPRNLRVFHVTSLALHVVTVALVFLIVQRILGSAVAAALAALLYGLHPLTVEPIAAVGERKTLLATCLAFASMLAYLRTVRAGRGRGIAMAWSVALFALALLAKPSVTPLPLLLLLLDHWPLRRLSRAAVLEKWPFFALSAASSAVTMLSVARTWELGTLPPPPALRTTLQIGYLIGFYLGKIAWPRDLSTVYAPPSTVALSEPAVSIGVATAAALAVLIILAWRRGPGVVVGCGVFLLGLVPTFGILVWNSMIGCDRYVYFPGLGIAIVVGVAIAAAWRAPALRGPAPRAAWLALVLALAVAEARGTRAALRPWKDSLSIWRNAVAVAPRMPDAYTGLGATLASEYAHDEAMAVYRRAIEVGPFDIYANLGLGALLNLLGRPGEAIPYLERAVAGAPGSSRAAWMLGLAYKSAGRLDDAEAQFRRALKNRPTFTPAEVQLGIVALLRGRSSEGIETLRRAAGRAPEEAYARFGLAMGLLHVRGADAEALDLLRQAVALDPEWAIPTNQLAWLLSTLPDPALRDTSEALRLAASAVELTHGRDANALDTQGAALAAALRFDEAIRSGRAAIALAERAGGDSLATPMRERIATYERHQPYLEPVPAPKVPQAPTASSPP
jgi:protein O-mannosyl-transferase